jgi:hypothetical protein
MNDDGSIWCYQRNHAMSSRTKIFKQSLEAFKRSSGPKKSQHFNYCRGMQSCMVTVIQIRDQIQDKTHNKGYYRANLFRISYRVRW